MSTPDRPLSRTIEVLQRDIAAGQSLGAQLYVSLNNRVIADLAIGQSRHGVPMTPATLNRWYSCCKPLVAVAIAQLWEKGLLDPDDPVVRHIPEFAANGKQSVTIRHLLTHTAGFGVFTLRWNREPWDEFIAKLCALPLEEGWLPGRKAAYHGSSASFIAAEIVRRLDGRPYDQYVRDMLFLPLGMNDSWLSIPPDRFATYGPRIGHMYDTDGHPPRPEDPPPTAEECAALSPAGSARGPMRELARFYEMMLNKGRLGSARIRQPQTAEVLVARHRVGMYDHNLQAVVDWGLGFIMNSNHYGKPTPHGPGGAHASMRAFGHGGMRSSCSFADPEHALVVAWVCNGMPSDQRHDERRIQVNDAIYTDLKLI
jgi:CubicO group peptidase (beta-lactamase class C family)